MRIFVSSSMTSIAEWQRTILPNLSLPLRRIGDSPIGVQFPHLHQRSFPKCDHLWRRRQLLAFWLRIPNRHLGLDMNPRPIRPMHAIREFDGVFLNNRSDAHAQKMPEVLRGVNSGIRDELKAGFCRFSSPAPSPIILDSASDIQ